MRTTEPTKTEYKDAPVSLRDRVLTRLWFVLMLLPLVGGMLLNLFLTPPSEGITVTGAQIYFTIQMPLQPLYWKPLENPNSISKPRAVPLKDWTRPTPMIISRSPPIQTAIRT